LSRQIQPRGRVEECYDLLVKWHKQVMPSSPHKDGYWQLPGNPKNFLTREKKFSITTAQYVLHDLGDRFRYERVGQSYTWWIKPPEPDVSEAEPPLLAQPTTQEQIISLVGTVNTGLAMISDALNKLVPLIGDVLRENEELPELQKTLALY
jgi:hypothetical protein